MFNWHPLYSVQQNLVFESQLQRNAAPKKVDKLDIPSASLMPTMSSVNQARNIPLQPVNLQGSRGLVYWREMYVKGSVILLFDLSSMLGFFSSYDNVYEGRVSSILGQDHHLHSGM